MINTQIPSSTANSMVCQNRQNESEKNPMVGAIAGGAGIGLVGFGLKTALDAAQVAAISFDACRGMSYLGYDACRYAVMIAPTTTLVGIATPVIIAAVSFVAAKYCFQTANKNL